MIYYNRKTTSSPEIILDGINLTIKGKSLMKHPDEFYKKILEVLTLNPPKSLSVDLRLEYLNTSSRKEFSKLFKVIEMVEQNEILWFYEEDDEDIKELGEDFKELFPQLNFLIIPI